ncbi:unnamed protein product [Acanthoscelides obtectus]|uniref:Uncharacterized protein n=1 Tax=Acanthoscelides obtectus TaxID=200917 RepID=A0A9P0P7Y2_ACAOB|nr:unnamed protein product [Acanthoscelides obtectus]CAK1657540.1 hypothetical protein AOBTE_LOCUS20407 [Acanthoscelides obtectus]
MEANVGLERKYISLHVSKLHPNTKTGIEDILQKYSDEEWKRW